MTLLHDKVAIITGAASGIGEATARLFAQEGCSTFILDVSAERGQSVAESIRKGGAYAEARTGDVRDPDSVAKIVDEAVGRFGRLDILVNNAGIYPRRAFIDMTSREWDEVQESTSKGRSTVPGWFSLI